MEKKLLIAFYCLILSANSIFAGPSYIDYSKKTPFNSGLRSFILPGWGQVDNKQSVKGYVVGGSAALSLIYSFSLDQQANRYYNDYQKNGVIDSSLYTDYENNLTQSKNISYLAAGIWIYGILDAYFTAKNNIGRDESEKNDKVVVNYTKSGASLSYAFGKEKVNVNSEKKERLTQKAAEKKVNIAVAEFTGKNVPAADVIRVTDFIRTALVSVNRFNILDSADMEMILAKHRFNMTGCASAECLSRMGKMLDVEIILTGSLAKLSDAYQISVSLVNVETGDILQSIDQSVKTAAELEQACKQVVEKIK